MIPTEHRPRVVRTKFFFDIESYLLFPSMLGEEATAPIGAQGK